MSRKDQLNFVINAIDKTKPVFRFVGKGLVKLSGYAKSAGLAATGAGAAFAYMLKQTADGIDETGKLSRQLGISVKELESFKLAAKLGGSSMETFAKASKQVSKAVFDFVKRGTGEAKDAFRELGITTSELLPIMNDNAAVFDLVSDRFKGMENSSIKTAVAMKMFGVRGVEMLSVFEGGSKSLKEIAAEAERFGLVLDTKQVKAVENANDELTRFGSVLRGIAKQVTAELFPKIGEIATYLREKVLKSIEESYGSVRNFGKDIAKLISEGATNAFLTMLQIIREMVVVVRVFTDAVKTMVDFLTPVGQLLNFLLDAVVNLYKTILPIVKFSFKGGLGADVEDPRIAFQKELRKKQTVESKGLDTGRSAISESLLSAESRLEKSIDWLKSFKEQESATVAAVKAVNEEVEKQNVQLDETPQKYNAISEAIERMKGGAEKAGDIIANNFEDAIFKAKSFEDAVRSIGEELARLAFREAVTKPFAEFISSSISGFMSPADAKAPATASAKGNAFTNGKLLPFANGGIVSTPTSFALAGGRGLMAEAGSEAILPLKRSSSGVLGVESSGSGSKVSVNIIDQRSSGAAAQVSEERGQDGSRSISVVIRDEVKRGFAEGSFDKSLRVFGLSRGGIRR